MTNRVTAEDNIFFLTIRWFKAKVTVCTKYGRDGAGQKQQQYDSSSNVGSTLDVCE
jgi:hypothetical protein